MINWIITLLCILAGRQHKTSPFETDVCHCVLPYLIIMLLWNVPNHSILTHRSRVDSGGAVYLSPLLVVISAHLYSQIQQPIIIHVLTKRHVVLPERRLTDKSTCRQKAHYIYQQIVADSLVFATPFSEEKVFSRTGRVVASPKPQIRRSAAVGISLRCLAT